MATTAEEATVAARAARSFSTDAPLNLRMVAELVCEFDGAAEKYNVWESQIKLIKTTYILADDVARMLVSMKLRGKPFEWLHSKAEHVIMPFEQLLTELRQMYSPKQTKIDLRKRFETRKWEKSETFREYAHEKIILGNRVPIDEGDMLDYLIDGIGDRSLYNQARMQCFDNKEFLIEAFDKIIQSECASEKPKHLEKHCVTAKITNSAPSDKKKELNQAAKLVQRKCFNCGIQGHLSTNCPSKESGPKCFKCGEYGHIASKCIGKEDASKRVCSITERSGKKYTKQVMIEGNYLEALFDTGSDLTIMPETEYQAIGSPSLLPTRVHFNGIGNSTHMAIGEFETTVVVDGKSFPILIRVVSNAICNHQVLIGADFLSQRNFHACKGTTYFDEDDQNSELPEILQINVTDYDETLGTTVSHVNDKNVKNDVVELVKNYKPNKEGETSVSMKLILKDDEPVYQRARRLAPYERDVVNAQVDDWLQLGIVRPSSSEYASPVVLVRKKDGSPRLCIDYRALNKKIVRDRYPLPLIEDQLDKLQGAKVFSTLDLKNGFFHIPMSHESIKLTSFLIPDGQYEFLKVPFGLCNSPAVFQRYINSIFRDVIRDGVVLVYMDDLIVVANNYSDGVQRLKCVLEVASKAGLEINWGKCRLLCERVEFLGYIIEAGTVRPSKHKTTAVTNFPKPTTIRQVQSFLGLTGYFRKFVPRYSTIARPLSNLLKTDVKFQIGKEEEDAFNTLKAVLAQQPVLDLYRVGAETELHTDASKHGYGAILLQRNSEDGYLHPVYFASGKTTSAEEKYTSYELEVLAVVKALRKFRVYLLGIPFKLVTDCKAFALTLNKKDLCVRVARWALMLEEFSYSVEHRAGECMRHVDALSRYPLPTCFVVTECEEGLFARLKLAQRDDAELKAKVELAKTGKLNGYSMQRNVLFKDVGQEMRLVVPRPMQLQIIRHMHERGHFGVAKTETLVANEYWIPCLRTKVEKVIRNCLPCILAERKHGKQQGLLNPIDKGSIPLDTYHIDHLGPMPSSKKSYAHILVVIDAFSKFVWLYATRSTTAVEAINCLKRQALIFANPRRIISDRGSAFTSREFAEYCQSEAVEHVLTTTGVPRGNGQVERVNRTLIPILTKLAAPRPGEWYRHLNQVQRCLNTTLHRTTASTPFKLMFGVDARTKEDLQIAKLLDQELVVLFDDERNELRKSAMNEIQRVQTENKRYYDRNRRPAFQYREGDIVAIRRTQQGPGSKFAHKYFGPYEVTKGLRNDRYVVRRIGDGAGPRETSTAADSMKLWANGQEDGDSDTDEEEDDSRADCQVRTAECKTGNAVVSSLCSL